MQPLFIVCYNEQNSFTQATTITLFSNTSNDLLNYILKPYRITFWP